MNRTTRKNLRGTIALLICLILMSSFFAPVFSWYINRLSTKIEIDSGIVGSYFEQGNGTEDTPYVIARPIQLYYFAWLQNLGFFNDDNPSSTTSDKKFYFTLGANIDMSENLDYSVLPPIGTPEYPFIGVFDGKYHYAPTDEQGNPTTDPFDPNNTKEGQYHIISNLKVSNTGLSNIPISGETGMQYIGLFGVIGSVTDVNTTGVVKNFGLYNVTLETQSPIDDKTIIGIVAGYCNGEFEGIGVSNCTVKVKNGVSPVTLTTHQVNADTDEVTSSVVTPETLSFSLVGFSDKTYQAYNLSPVAGGDEFGGSLAMESVFNKILSVKNSADSERMSYNIEKVVNIDENGVRTESYSNEVDIDYHRSLSNVANFYYLKEYEELDDGDVTESYSLVERYSDSSKVLITDGLGNYLEGYYSGGTYSLRNTTNRNSATQWTMATYSSYYRFSASINNATRYLYYSGGNLTLNSSTYNWTVTNTDTEYQDYLIKTNSGNNYIVYDDGWKISTTATTVNLNRLPGSAVNQYMYLNGGRTIEKKQNVTTITRTRYDAYLIQDENGNYLVGTPSGISNTTNSANATAWRFSNGASGGTFTIQDENEVTYYLYNNAGTLQVSSSNSTNWAISNGEITNGGYYLVYLDGAWKLREETTYYSIDNNNGTYLNFANSNVSGGASSTTKWHFTNGAGGGKLYTYVNDTKTYIYNNNGTLATTTNANTATAWTVSSGHITNNGYYLLYLDGSWTVLQETTYYSINNGVGTYLNFANGNITSGASSTTRWHIADGKIYTYNGTTKTYLYNNSGTLTTTTNSGTASVWSNSNGHITNGGYYLVYLDGAWKLWQETTYYAINNGNGTYLNLNNGDIVGGASSTTRWHFSNGASGGQIYTFVNGTKTYLYNNNGTLTTTTNSGTASTWALDSNNHNLTSGGYYLGYNDGVWKLTEETEYYLIDNNNNVYLNLSGGNIANGTQQTATRWYNSNGKIYAYNGTTKTYLYNNGGTLTTTTNSATASTWVIDGANDYLTNNGYYLCYNDGAWGVTQEAGYYFINDGNGVYLNLSGGNVANGTQQTATRWFNSNGKLYSYNNGTKTYLLNNGGVLSTTTTENSATTWTTENNNIKSGNYYLVYQDGWILTTETSYDLISDGSGNYLNLSAGNIVVGTSSNATRWHISNGKIYTYVNGTATYLINSTGSLGTTTAQGSATTWTISNNNITNNGYYLIYQNDWLLTNETSYYLISDGSGNYLNLTGSGFDVGTSSNATSWHFTNGASGGLIYTHINGTRTYLVNSAGTLSTTTTQGSASSWTVSNGQISNGGYYISYNGVWRLTNVSTYYTISDGEGNYLNLTGSGFEVGTSSNATDWQITNTSSGKIYTYVNGTATYLYNNNGTLTTTTNANTGTTWTIDNTNGNIKNNGYYLTYNSTGSTWEITNNVHYYLIHDNNNHYMNLNNQALTEVGTSSNATAWHFSNGSSGGNISAKVGNTTYYLNYVNGNMVPQTTASTSWTVNGSTIYCVNSSTNYYMFCDGSCWTIVRNGLTSYYLISQTSSNNYLSCSVNGNTVSIANETVRSYARKWEFDSRMSTSSGYPITTNINGTTYNLYRNSYTLQISSSNSTNWRYNSGSRYIYYRSGYGNTYRYIRYYNSGWTSLGSSATAIGSIANVSSSTRNAVRVASDVQPDLVAQYSSGSYNFTNSISSSNYDLSVNTNNNNYNLTANIPYTAYSLTADVNSTSYSVTVNTPSTNYNVTANMNSSSYNILAETSSFDYDITNRTEETTVVWKNTVKTVETAEIKGKETYIPLAENEDGTTSLRNTGYIVSGSNYGVQDTYSGDIRVSYYAMSNLYRALGYSSNSNVSYSSSRLEIVTRTYLSNGYVRISDTYNSNNGTINSDISTKFPTKSDVTTLGLDKYTDSRAQLEETLDGADNVYGLHFMDAQINANNLVNIGKATINGSTYNDYKMPQDCIDFNLNTKGSLNFYAGTYFPGNSAFFSLHHIVRSAGEIVSINEISKIYGDPTNSAKSYIYEYVGGSTPTLPSGYVLMFDTSWIKNPGQSMVEYAMYYFEIPVNAGEYALGSVDGADGAYLIYLDIGASAKSLADGTTLETAIKGIEFVTYSSLNNSLSTTLSAITSETTSSAVIILKNRFQGDISFNIQTVVVDGVDVLRIGYTLSDTSSKDYVKWTKASSSAEVVDNTVYT